MKIEIIGTLASIIILTSYICKDQKKLRLINIIGSLLFITYGILKGSFSLIFLNTTTILIHIIRIIGGNNGKRTNKTETSNN